LSTGKTLTIATGADPEDYLPRLAWTPKGQLVLTRMNRHQNHLWLLSVDPSSGKVETLMEETSIYYLDLHEPHFLSDGSGFIWQSEKSGFNHLYRYDMKGKEKAALTKGNFDVTGWYGVDEKNEQVFYQAASANAMQREIFSVNLKGKKTQKISDVAGFHSAQFSGNFDYYIHSYSTLNDPPRFAVRDRNGRLVRELEQNDRVRNLQKTYGTVAAEFFQVPLNYEKDQPGGPWQGYLNGFMMKPNHTPAGTKHPVLMFAYGGPGSQQALDQWKGANYWWFQMLVQQGFVVVCVDNRGTGARGEAFKKATYLQLGKLETIDQIAAARFMGTQPFVDAGRIGIFGWSFGGYLSSLCLLKGNDVFNSAIAVAPVTNWKWYDSIYTERYMRTHKENPNGYEDNSPVNFAEQLQGNYLLVHGLTDDNVHFQHSAEMYNELIKNDKQFDSMIYPNRNHGIGDKAARMHLYRTMTQFLMEKLAKETGAAKP
jgi:dipeptidyl-peptidase-4